MKIFSLFFSTSSLFLSFQCIFFLCVITCVYSEGDDLIDDSYVKPVRRSMAEHTTPYSYVVENLFPETNVLFVNETYQVRIWPKNEKGENITVVASKLQIIPQPLEVYEIRRVEKNNPIAIVLEFEITEPQNPCVIYLFENDKTVAAPIKFAAIEESKICRKRSTVSLEQLPVRAGDEFFIEIDFKDAFGRGTLEGMDQVKFASTYEMSKFNMHRISQENNNPKIRFSLNCTETGEFPMNITYRNKHISGSPFIIQVVPNEINHETSKIMGFGSWVAQIAEVNTLYVQLFDIFENEIVSTPTKTSLTFENEQKNENENENEKENLDSENEEITGDLDTLNSLITLKGWTTNRKPLENLNFLVEYIGKSTWGIRYSIPRFDELDTSVFLGLFYKEEKKPIGGVLSVFLQLPGFPYPPNSYQMLGPFPARPEITEPAPSSLAVVPNRMPSYKLDKTGWLSAQYSSIPVSDVDYRAELIGSFHVENPGAYLFICKGAEQYIIDYPILYSGDVWNLHELSEGHHTLQVSVLAKRDWNFEFQCRFQLFKPLKAYSSGVLVPDFIKQQGMVGDIQILLQNLQTSMIKDLQVRVLAVNDTKIFPIASFTHESSRMLPPQELTKVSIHLDFTEDEKYQLPVDNFLVVLAFYSETLRDAVKIPVTVRVRSSHQLPFRFIFEDNDESKQLAVAVPPSEPCENLCPVILVSHGGGVSTTTLAEFLPPQKNAWWLIPDGRTIIPYEIGPLFHSHSMKSIEGLSLLVSSTPIFSSFLVNENSIISIGSHYHGGKGALLLANYYPDRMLGVSADSGWIKHGQPRLDDFLHPMISGIIQFASIHNEITETVNNLRYVPLLAGSGKGDTAGYPWRLFYQQTLLEKNNVEARPDPSIGLSYKKYPTAAISMTNDVLDFIEKRLTKAKSIPKQFTVSSWNPGFYHGRGGIYISAMKEPLYKASIDVHIQGDLWILDTVNTQAFEIRVIDAIPRASQILIDGSDSFMIDTNEKIRFYLDDEGRWKEQLEDGVFRKANQYGPVTRLYEDKLIVVCGTKGPADVTQLYQLFSVYIANELYKQHRHDVQILSDIQYQNLPRNEQSNIFLIGGPQTNHITSAVLENNPVPISFENGELKLDACTLSCNRETAAIFLAPHGDHLAFIVSASSFPLMQSVTHILPLHTAYDHFPDFVIIDKDHTWKGGNAIISTGYWNSKWQFSPLSSFHQCPTYVASAEPCSALW